MLLFGSRLQGVHPDLVKVIDLASRAIDIEVLEGVRSIEHEKILIMQGHSALKDPTHCRHCTGHAVDLGALIRYTPDGPLESRWDWPAYDKIAVNMKLAAGQLHIPIEWGGDWTSFKDGPHFQLPMKEYPP